MASFSSLQSTHIATTFHKSELQVGGIIRKQIRDEAKDEIESRTGRIRPLDGNLLQQQRKGIYQEIQPSREACSKMGLGTTTYVKGL